MYLSLERARRPRRQSSFRLAPRVNVRSSPRASLVRGIRFALSNHQCRHHVLSVRRQIFLRRHAHEAQNVSRLERLVRPKPHRPDRLHRAHYERKNAARSRQSRIRSCTHRTRARCAFVRPEASFRPPRSIERGVTRRPLVSSPHPSVFSRLAIAATRALRLRARAHRRRAYAHPLFAMSTLRIARAPPRERT